MPRADAVRSSQAHPAGASTQCQTSPEYCEAAGREQIRGRIDDRGPSAKRGIAPGSQRPGPTAAAAFVVQMPSSAPPSIELPGDE